MIVDPRIEQYLHDLLPAPDAVEALMEREGQRAAFPIVGPLVGRLLSQLTRATAARDVFEMGSGFGYSTLFFARALDDNGRVVHTDTSAELSARARRHLERAGLLHRVAFEVGDACEIITRYPGPFDIIFIDVDKEQYPTAFELARVRVRPGGFIITDNVLWHGRILEPRESWDAATAAVDHYNRLSAAAPDFLTTILPLRDGVALHCKVGETPRRSRPPSSPAIKAVPKAR